MSVYKAASTAAFDYVNAQGYVNSYGKELEVFAQNVDVETKPTDTHLKMSLRKTQPDKYTIGAGDCGTMYIWILQVSICEKDNLGNIEAEGIADQIVDSFLFAHVIGNNDIHLKITDAPLVFSGVENDGWVEHPVQIRLMKTDDVITPPKT